jgi:hypothetical protein
METPSVLLIRLLGPLTVERDIMKTRRLEVYINRTYELFNGLIFQRQSSLASYPYNEVGSCSFLVVASCTLGLVDEWALDGPHSFRQRI